MYARVLYEDRSLEITIYIIAASAEDCLLWSIL